MFFSWSTDSDTELDPIIRQFWEKFKDDPIHRSKAVPVLAEYYFIVKGDVVRAIPFQKEFMISRTDEVSTLHSKFRRGIFYLPANFGRLLPKYFKGRPKTVLLIWISGPEGIVLRFA